MSLPWHKGRKKKVNRRNIVKVKRDWSRTGAYIGYSSLLLIVTSLFVLSWTVISDPRTLPIKQLKLEGQLDFVSTEQVRQLIRTHTQVGFFSVDVGEVTQSLIDLPWVDRAIVRREWPDSLHVILTEHSALARWTSGGLINVRGERFFPVDSSIPKGLMELDGPEATLAMMAERYKRLKGRLKAVGVVKITLTSRRAWQMTLDNGVEVMLGRQDMDFRLDKFFQFYPGLIPRIGDIKQIDMRYPNGFAVMWREGENALG